MQTPDISADITDFLTERYLFDREGFVLGCDDSLIEQQVLDSLGVLSLVSFLEQQYGISVLAEDVSPANFGSVRSIADFVAEKLSA